jgi:hypothetical protein
MKQEPLARIEGRIPARQKVRIEEIARVHGVHTSEIVRKAVDLFLEQLDKKNVAHRDMALADQLDRQQQRLVALLIKTMRGIGQVMFITGQMWELGTPPADGLTEEEMRELWSASRRYAKHWIKNVEES